MDDPMISVTITKDDLENVLLALLLATNYNKDEEVVEQLNKTIDRFYPHVGVPFKTAFDLARRCL